MQVRLVKCQVAISAEDCYSDIGLFSALLFLVSIGRFASHEARDVFGHFAISFPDEFELRR